MRSGVCVVRLQLQDEGRVARDIRVGNLHRDVVLGQDGAVHARET